MSGIYFYFLHFERRFVNMVMMNMKYREFFDHLNDYPLVEN